MRHCGFCDEIAGGSRNEFADIYGNGLRRTWLSSPRFVAVPSLGQLAAGHSLIIPRRHVLSLGHLPGNDLTELEAVQGEVGRVLGEHYGEPIWFEHGCVDEGPSGGCGIYHAHLHALPLDHDLRDVPLRLSQQFARIPILNWENLSERIASGRPYLFYQSRSGDRRLYHVSSLPSQFMRQLIAEELGYSGWDWRAAGFEDELVSNVRCLEAATAVM